MARRYRWLVDFLVGTAWGAALGAILAVNVVIFSGVDRGYQASISEVFDHNPVVGFLTVAILAAGPVLGVVTMRRLRNR